MREIDLKILIELLSNGFLFSSAMVSCRKINPISKFIPVRNAAAKTGTDATDNEPLIAEMLAKFQQNFARGMHSRYSFAAARSA